MNKKVLFLPIVALFSAGCLVSCNKDGGNDKKPCNHVDTNPADHYCDLCKEALGSCVDEDFNGKCDVCGLDVIPDIHVDPSKKIAEPEEFGGYKRVYIPEDGHEYLLGMYQESLQEMIFMNGAPHRDKVQTEDDAGNIVEVTNDYLYYFACQRYPYVPTEEGEEPSEPQAEVDAGLNASRIIVRYVDTVHFYFELVRGTGLEQYYDDPNSTENTVLTVYGDKNEENGKIFTSIKFIPKSQMTDACYFRFADKVTYRPEGTAKQQTVVVNGYITEFQNPYKGQYSAKLPVGLGTHDMYPNIEAETIEWISTSFMAHLWEKIPDEVPAEQ